MKEFKCKRCGNCCSNYLPLSNKEFNDLKNIIKKRKLKSNKRIFESNYYHTCPFLNANNKCDIYEDRPMICKSFTCNWDMSNTKELTKEFRPLRDLRKELFGEKNG